MSKPRTSLNVVAFVAFVVLLLAQSGTAKEPVRVDTLNARNVSSLESLLRVEVVDILEREARRAGEPSATTLLRSVRIVNSTTTP